MLRELTAGNHYTYIIPLCSATMGLGEYGTIDVAPGDVVAVLAAEVPHSLRSAEGAEGYVVTCWTEDRIVRLIEYAQWLEGQPQS